MSIRKSRSRRALVVALTAALGALAIAGLTLGYVLAGDDTGTQAAAPAPTASAKSPACAEVTRQYTWWKEESRSLAGLPNLAPAAAAARAKELSDDGYALVGTLAVYGDASTMAEEATKYSVRAALLKVDIELGGEVNASAYDDVLTAHQSVDDAYTAFLRSSC